VRLNIEEVQRHKQNKYSVECIKGIVNMSSDGDLAYNLCDTIEAQQQEIERLEKCYSITNSSRKEQIRANKRQEKAIRNMKAYMYDIEKGLRIAKDALISISEYWNGSSSDIAMIDACTNNKDTALEALAAIDKALGGMKDGI
jgi:vacuolar-type H+-ATPase subunit I/STV1